MSRRALRFWGSAAGAAGGAALLLWVLFPYGALGLDAPGERWRVWLLILWTAGVMSILFGASALLGAFSGLGVRDVVEAGSLGDARERRRQARSAEGEASGAARFHSDFGWWLVCTGGLLIGTYFAAWLLGGP